MLLVHANLRLSLLTHCTVGHSVLNLVHVLVVRICLISEPDCILHLYLYRSDRAVTMIIPG